MDPQHCLIYNFVALLFVRDQQTWKNEGRFLCLPDLVCSRSGGITSASGSQSLSSESSSPPPPLRRPCNFPDFLSDRSRFMKIQKTFIQGSPC
jgi:hypothetical protein